MKRLSNYLLGVLAIASVLFFASCGEDDGTPSTPAPTISLDNSTIDVLAGDDVVVNVTGTSSTGLNTMTATVSVDGTDQPTQNIYSKASGTTVTDPVTIEYTLSDIDASLVGASVTVTFTAVDDDNQTSSAVLTVNVTGIPVSIYTAILLAPPTGDEMSLTFFSSTEGITYSVNSVNTTANTSPKIDFGYYYGVTDEASIASPAAYPSAIFDLAAEGWDEYNATLFRESGMSVADFDAIGASGGSAVAAEFEVGTAEGGIKTQLAVDDILAFSTDAGDDSKFGLIKVVSIDAGSGVGDGITIEVKVVQ